MVSVMLSPVLLFAEDAASVPGPAAFLESVRYPDLIETWAVMDGTVRHKVRGARALKLPIALRLHMHSERTQARLTLADSERYMIERTATGDDAGITVTRTAAPLPDAMTLHDIGLQPGDLTLSFLYWTFATEHESTTVRGQRCRVMKLVNPDKPEHAIVYISEKYRFPLKVECFAAAEPEPTRTITFTGFEKVDGLWVIKEVKIQGDRWKSIIDFRDNTVGVVTPDTPVPADLFADE